MDTDLKEYLGMSLGNLTQELSRLTAIVERQSTMIREIEIRSTTRVAELQKDIDEIRSDIRDVKEDQRTMDESQKFKWKTLTEERNAEKKDRESKDRIQAVKNNQMDTVNKLLWAILIIVAGMALSFIWELIKNGGIRGMIT
jgi:TPP-dependent indolepyruvate ferredoxin oxidoreductase alpha subunit